MVIKRLTFAPCSIVPVTPIFCNLRTETLYTTSSSTRCMSSFTSPSGPLCKLGSDFIKQVVTVCHHKSQSALEVPPLSVSGIVSVRHSREGHRVNDEHHLPKGRVMTGKNPE